MDIDAQMNNLTWDGLTPEDMPTWPDVTTVVSWPPKVIQSTPMGYIRDCPGNYMPRDIGRSSVLSDGTVLFQFGDTFVHGPGMEFLGLVDHTIAFKCPEGHGVTCTVSANKLTPATSTKESLISGYELETVIPKPILPINRIEPLQSQEREATWIFSGIVDLNIDASNTGLSPRRRLALGPGERTAWTWFEARKFEKETTDLDGKYLRSGVAKLKITHWHDGIQVVAVDQDYLFDSKEPRFGTFCAVADEDGRYVYCYGHLNGSGYELIEKHVGLARVNLRHASIAGEYKYWDGKGWVHDMKCAVPVLASMQHGQIFRTKMFASDYPWAFLGCSSFGDSKAIFGRAKSPEGPWDCYPLDDLQTYGLIKTPDCDFRYCFYPHPWAFGGDSLDMMITWCEGGMNGNVVADRVRFKSEKKLVTDKNFKVKMMESVLQKMEENKAALQRKLEMEERRKLIREAEQAILDAVEH